MTFLRDDISRAISAIRTAIDERAAAEAAIRQEFGGGDDDEHSVRKAGRELDDRYRALCEEERTAYDHARHAAIFRLDQERRAIEIEQQALVEAARSEYERESEIVTRTRTDGRWILTSLLDDESHESPKFQFESLQRKITATRNRLRDEQTVVDQFVAARQALMDDRRQGRRESQEELPHPPANLEEAESRLDAAGRTIRDRFYVLQSQWLSRLFTGWRPALVLLGMWALWCLPWIVAAMLRVPVLHGRPIELDSAVGWLLASGVAALLSFGVLLQLARMRSALPYEEIIAAEADFSVSFHRWQTCAPLELKRQKEAYEERQQGIDAQRQRSMASLQANAARRQQEIEARRRDALAEVEQKFPPLLRDLEAREKQELAAIDDVYRQRMAHHDAELQAERNRVVGTFESNRAERQRARLAAEAESASRWGAALHDFQVEAIAAREQVRQSVAPFAAMTSPEWTLPDAMSRTVEIGRIVFAPIPECSESLPLALEFPEAGSLLLRCGAEGREAAVESLRAIMLRLLASFPVGKVRFTVIDPVGLGEQFSGFMHLADYDEKLVGQRIWTEPAQIERRLTEISEHMENVFQAYLRNEFATIDDYNEHAGEVAEPYHFLFVLNFPANFTETAARRLLSIAGSGPRCGVYTLLSVDGRHPLPHNFDIGDLEAKATTLEWRTGWRMARHPQLVGLPIELLAPATNGELTEIVHSVGRQSKAGRRVEVPFERIAPPGNALWQLDSRGGLSIPLGRAGATKLQHLALGKGTSQHVLVAGKTGSGKSSLLHTVITNLALHYSPDEVEFYLVDFKKGVEFKAYAVHALPHARVIGIESDREFGVSVLERLDAVLRERGILFREQNVQDLASFRKARPEVRMPRIMLIVDEFQEFFVEEDGLAQQATLLLDRLVRQGRAFGVHVFLGSQTLGGAYSLARSTLGQMAVRIALQCSETDAHLILSEENMAARLLSRPGEAIYNDANGLAEGNHPFQIAWLPDESRDSWLAALAEKARSSELLERPTIVFEGNVPSDLVGNRRLAELVQTFRDRMADGREQPAEQRLWLGESVSIEDPPAIEFTRQPGDNLLVVGQDAAAVRGMFSAALVALAAQVPVDAGEAPAFYLIDGDATGPAPGPVLGSVLGPVWQELIDAVPHAVATGTQRTAAEKIDEIAAEVQRRIAGDTEAPPMFVFLLNLTRMRALRSEPDDFSFSQSEKPVGAGEKLAEILREGPAVGVHVLAWCDTFANLARWMTPQTVKEFEVRVALQMNSIDSSNMIDSPAASKLGSHRGLLYSRTTGEVQKFRPYAEPSATWLAAVAERLGKAEEDETSFPSSSLGTHFPEAPASSTH